MKNRWNELLINRTFRDHSIPISSVDGRNPFENDYSRLVSSSFVRRLQDKTQVFPLPTSDSIRTRLTHSLEVSWFAYSIGKSIENELIKLNELDKNKIGHIPSLLQTAGLIHDLGNPPFGHFGEEAIKKYFSSLFNTSNKSDLAKQLSKKLNKQEKNDFIHFDGNVQTLRILKSLQFLKDEHSFNLTYPTLSTIIKYPRNSVKGNVAKEDRKTISEKKFGYFSSEEKYYKILNKTLKLNNERHPLTFLLEAADDIAYSAADIEDGVKLGILTFEHIHDIFNKKLDKGNKIENQILEELDKSYEFYKGLGSDRLSLTVQKFRIYTQSKMIESIVKEFIKKRKKILSGVYTSELLKDCELKNVREAYENLTKILFKNTRVIETELAGEEIITGLLDLFVNASIKEDFKEDGNSHNSRLYNLIASNYRYIYEKYSQENYKNPIYNKIQLVTDFISSMTDSYALNLFRRLKGIQL